MSTVTKSERLNGLMTYQDIAEQLRVSVSTVSGWTSESRPARKRLRIVDLGHRTKLVKPTALQRFLKECEL